jgi:tRNA (guanine-N7-)-methyltransferase
MTPKLERTRVTPRERHRRHANPFSIRVEVAPLKLAAYAKAQPLALDIGFGEGIFAIDLARQHPEWNVLGFEIREHYVRFLNDGAEARGLTNLHGVQANASTHLDIVVPDKSVIFAAINFPDPWFKRRHMKRRVLTLEWLALLEKKLLPRAELHAMSDYEPIAKEMAKVMNKAPGWEVVVPLTSTGPSTTGIMTEREARHSGRGEPIHRMAYRYLGG